MKLHTVQLGLAVFAITLAGASAWATLGRPSGVSPRAVLAANTLTPPSLASTPTPTTLPAKPASDGNLTGVYDVLVTGGSAGSPLKDVASTNCILYSSHDATTNVIKSATQCVSESGIGDPHNELGSISVPGEGWDGVPGSPPPPPYLGGKPSKGSGYYYPGSDKFISVICFPNVGGTYAPNIISVVDVQSAKAQLAASGKMQGQLYLYANQSKSQCDSLTPGGAYVAGIGLAVKLYPISNGSFGNAPWRTDADTDYDNDGCTDAQELSKPATPSCGDDPWNPYDSNNSDLGGAWYFQATSRRADTCVGGTWLGQGSGTYDCTGAPDGTFVPGAYFHCYADTEQVTKSAIDTTTTKIVCYIDFGPATAQGAGTPLAVNPQLSATGYGDGKAGPAPPGRTVKPSGPRLFADIEQQHTSLAGVVDGDTWRLWGCWLDQDGMGPLGRVYLEGSINRYTWQGWLSLWAFQSQPNCQGDTPSGAPVTVPFEGVKQSTSAAERDTDQDGCPDKYELTDDTSNGGLRDPANPWDYFNPSNDRFIRMDDVLAVVDKFGIDDPAPGYHVKFDRGGGVLGSNQWNLAPPNGMIRITDVLAAVISYGHDCGSRDPATFKTPTSTNTPRPTSTPKATPLPTKAAPPSFPLPTPS